MALPYEFDQFERRMAERHVAILTILTEIKKTRDSHEGRIRILERNVAVLSVAYGLGLVILGGLAYKFGWGQ